MKAMENSNTPWTPGPWAVFPHYCSGGVYSQTWLIGVGKYDTIAEVRPGHDVFDGQNDANARLIAAAPEMAAFIQKYVDAWRSGTGTVYLIDEAEAILASIEGKS